METILFLAHTEADGALARPALEALGAARSLQAALPGATLLAGLLGADVTTAANQIATCGASRFLGVGSGASGLHAFASMLNPCTSPWQVWHRMPAPTWGR